MIRYKQITGGYELMEDYSIRLTSLDISPVTHRYFYVKSGVLFIRRGYRWNGISYLVTTKRNIRASLAHDCMYQIIQLGLLAKNWQSLADGLFNRVMVEDREWEWYRWVLYTGVSKFGRYWL